MKRPPDPLDPEATQSNPRARPAPSASPGARPTPESILDSLNPAQGEAASHRHGPLMVLAGAGSGKTRVITHRIAYLAASGCPLDRILAITFTNKAAGEMRDRVEQITGERSPWISTFHSFSARVLRRYIYRIEPYDTSFTICDTDDCKSLIKELLKDLNVDSELWQPRSVLSAISKLKSQSNGDVDELGTDYRHGRVLRSIVLEYLHRMRERNLLDFDDLLLLTVRLFEEHPDVLERYREQFEFVLVDEYQDTNRLQYTICRQLTLEHGNLCITGDPDQSIYKWRGADISNILSFEKDYPGARTVKLEQNYRSSGNVLAVANALIAHNTERKDKELWTENAPGEPVHVFRTLTEHEEASRVVQTLKTFVDSGTPLGDVAIFYRINSLSRVLEQELIYANIPYSIVGGVEFFLRKEVKDVLAYLRVLANPRDSESLKRIINTPPRGIGPTTVAKLEAAAQRQGRGLLEVVLDRSLRAGDLKKAQSSKVDAFADLYRAVESAKGGSVESLVEAVVRESGYREHLTEKMPDEAEERIANIGEVVGAAVEYDKVHPDGDIVGFLELTAILGDVDRWEQRDDRVSLMTLHAAKGLEFPVVFIVGVEDGLVPLIRSQDEDPDIEEERRLLYVGITRAEERLHLSHVSSRQRFGRAQRSVPSRFLRELTPKEETADEGHETLRFDYSTEESLYEPREPARWRDFPARSGAQSHGFESEFSSPHEDTPFDSGESTPDGFPSDSHAHHDDPIAAEYAQEAPDGFDGFGPDGATDDDDPYPEGARVLHEEYGEGTVVRASGFGARRRVTIRFPEVGEQQFVIRFAPIQRIR